MAAAPSSTDLLELRVVDPGTLADLPEHEALPFGHHYTYAFSPDGRTLAAILWPSGQHNSGGVLHVIDLPSWKDQTTSVTFDEHVGALAFSPDGKSLYWLQPTGSDPAHGMPRDYVVYRFALSGGAPEVVTRLPGSFMPGGLRLLASGERAVILGQPTSGENLAEDVPHVLFLDLRTGQIDADLRLKGVLSGERQVQAGGEEGTRFEYHGAGTAWDTARERLYIVHSEGDHVTVVDLKRARVLLQTTIRSRLSLLERLGVVSRASAKMVPGTWSQVALSADGKRLLITGRRDELVQQSNGTRRWRQTPLGLRVVDTENFYEVARIDLPVSDMVMAPGGGYLLLWGAHQDCQAGASCVTKGTGVYVMAAGQVQAPVNLLPGTVGFPLGFSPDGRYAYVGEHVGSGADWRLAHRVLELTTARLVAERESKGNVSYLWAE